MMYVEDAAALMIGAAGLAMLGWQLTPWARRARLWRRPRSRYDWLDS